MKIHNINFSYSNNFLRFGLFSKKVNNGIGAKLDTSQYFSVGFYFQEIWGLFLLSRKWSYLKARLILLCEDKDLVNFCKCMPLCSLMKL